MTDNNGPHDNDQLIRQHNSLGDVVRREEKPNAALYTAKCVVTGALVFSALVAGIEYADRGLEHWDKFAHFIGMAIAPIGGMMGYIYAYETDFGEKK